MREVDLDQENSIHDLVSFAQEVLKSTTANEQLNWRPKFNTIAASPQGHFGIHSPALF
jgi:hypothetical protein